MTYTNFDLGVNTDGCQTRFILVGIDPPITAPSLHEAQIPLHQVLLTQPGSRGEPKDSQDCAPFQSYGGSAKIKRNSTRFLHKLNA